MSPTPRGLEVGRCPPPLPPPPPVPSHPVGLLNTDVKLPDSTPIRLGSSHCAHTALACQAPISGVSGEAAGRVLASFIPLPRPSGGAELVQHVYEASAGYARG